MLPNFLSRGQLNVLEFVFFVAFHIFDKEEEKEGGGALAAQVMRVILPKQPGHGFKWAYHFSAHPASD